MATPTVKFRVIPQNTPQGLVDLPSERLGDISGQQIVSTGAGNEANFGNVDISGGAENSGILTMLWNIEDDGGNTLVETFMLWLSDNGFDIGTSVIKVAELAGDDNASPGPNMENYVVSAVLGSYSWTTMDEAEPAGINVWPTDEGTSMTCPGTNGKSDDAIMWAMYAAIAAGETTGIYKGTDVGYELQFSFKFSYS
jgi:hypothetical protein